MECHTTTGRESWIPGVWGKVVQSKLVTIFLFLFWNTKDRLEIKRCHPKSKRSSLGGILERTGKFVSLRFHSLAIVIPTSIRFPLFPVDGNTCNENLMGLQISGFWAWLHAMLSPWASRWQWWWIPPASRPGVTRMQQARTVIEFWHCHCLSAQPLRPGSNVIIWAKWVRTTYRSAPFSVPETAGSLLLAYVNLICWSFRKDGQWALIYRTF
jgi:hypothetical protein